MMCSFSSKFIFGSFDMDNTRIKTSFTIKQLLFIDFFLINNIIIKMHLKFIIEWFYLPDHFWSILSHPTSSLLLFVSTINELKHLLPLK